MAFLLLFDKLEGVLVAWRARSLLSLYGIFAVAQIGIADDSFSVRCLEVTETIPCQVRDNVFDFGAAAFGWLELCDLPCGAYKVVVGEMTNSAGAVSNPYPGSSISCWHQSGVVDSGRVRVPGGSMIPDFRVNGIKVSPGSSAFGELAPFRYVQVVFAPGVVANTNLVRKAVHYPIDMSQSSFRCDNAVLNQVYEFCKYSILATSFCGIYVDGERERMPYEADAYINQLGHYAIDSDYAMARRTIEYLLENPTWPTEWKQHVISMAWADWMWSGDVGLLKSRYIALRKKLLGNYPRKDIVDWPPCERDNFVMGKSNAVVEAFHIRNLVEISEIANVVGETSDAAAYRRLAANEKALYYRKFVNPKTHLVVDGQDEAHSSLHANAIALAFGLVPDRYVDDVVGFLDRRGMACSVYFAHYLLEAFCKSGRTDLAVKYMSATGDRSWKRMMDFGSTITMEAWNMKVKPNQDLNHAWGTAPLNIISRFILGVTPETAGFGRIRVQPELGGLRWVRGAVPTRVGLVRIEMSDEKIVVDVPVESRVVLGVRDVIVSAGRHEFTR